MHKRVYCIESAASLTMRRFDVNMGTVPEPHNMSSITLNGRSVENAPHIISGLLSNSLGSELIMPIIRIPRSLFSSSKLDISSAMRLIRMFQLIPSAVSLFIITVYRIQGLAPSFPVELSPVSFICGRA